MKRRRLSVVRRAFDVERGPAGGAAHRPERGISRQSGFTLIEVLIALVLLSLLLLLLTSAMRSMGQTEDRVEQRVAAADDYRISVDFLHQVLGRVSARRFRSLAADTPLDMPFFEARPESLAWIGILPARYGAGGRHYMRLALESGRLVLRFAPWNGAPVFTAWGQAAVQPLAAPVQSFTLRYQDPASGQWSAVWPPPGMPRNQLPPSLLPSAVVLQVDGPEPPWPPLVIAVAPTRASDPLAGSESFGARR
ncbi:MAG: prepilin-type N-terminal cleavage/methylation domain-containing protein [Burkholderiaceae bacterium]|jgi:general secretion pathway protein J|nr:prepilin-type N-terminal cleavage/methylation domain-containing protein [Burkholderiaceae bacterium]